MASPRCVRRHVVDDRAVDAEIARGDLLETGDHAQQRRLAAARWADEDHELLIADGEVDALDDVDVAVAFFDVAEQCDSGH